MKTLKFKTNINCGGCVSKVTPFLNKQEGIESWEVDTDNPDKILTIKSAGASEEDVKTTLQKIGFKAESVSSN
ncbi:MAG: heavy-metal-associated domain-containing protein [Arenibacter sp.]|jgi:copper chaperone|uniref:Copper chaperone n=1 Tax=Arenibacter echinorum TaxID=440515 RepID=A0A327R8N2_9FLAO|nr:MULTISPECIES: heavy-metal-associated domain-containing protein [Arenibacter]MCK0191932.1 heavy-metal-associated domain-containing protein [Arenibacter sp. F20364]MCM4151952.1 copper chaperone [Arenibacter sp. N53]RAJ10267.1 copper chaperone [Arenibacter echinorum]|tara:strand:- start:520 stop:738 length:219 start_codon:yes stop_codon:yes gene_type:complete